jgi:TonB-dependent starch-binding outer membrane protein SusC
MKKLLQSLFILLFVASAAMAQNRTITGTVTSKDDGLPIPGVSVKVKGTNIGASTGANGKFSLSVPANSASLEISSIGYLPVTINIGSSDVINASLVTDSKALGEIIVTGYGTVSKKDNTASVSRISGSSVTDVSIPSFDRALAGKATGVQVITPSGLLGQAPQIRIRGINSISSGTSPLFVIDGVPSLSGNVGSFTSANALGDINPNDIESIDILKDGAATAVYGSRAANGVVLITTKRGKNGTQFSYDGYAAVANVSKRFDLLNADQFIEIANERYRNAGVTVVNAVPTPNGNGGFVDTDWQDVVFRQAVQQNHALSASGGTDKTKYYFSLGYSDQKGAIVANSLERYSLRANLDQKINKTFTFGITSGFTYQNNLGPTSASNALSGNIFAATRMLPNVPVYNAADPTGYNIAPDRRSLGAGSNLITISDNIPNILFVLEQNPRRSQTYRAIGNTYLEANIISGLKFKTQLGLDASFEDAFSYTDPRAGDGLSANGNMSQAYSPFIRWNWQNILTYTKSFNSVHNIDVTLVSEFQKDKNSFYQASISNISDIFFNQNITSNTFVTPNVAGGLTYSGIESYLARASYNYKSKYYLGASIRRDGLSALPEANRIGYFPGVSAAWRISEEDFFKNSNGLKFINELKLRGSFAEVGNTSIGTFPYLGTYAAAAYGNQSGIGFNQTGNPDLRWESQKSYDAGIEMALFNNKINIVAAYWKKDNVGSILSAPTPPSVGIPGNAINRNIGSITNNGLEFAINADVLSSNKLQWNTSLNFSTQNNKVLALVNGQDINPNGFNIIRVGESINALYGYQYMGVNMANGNPIYQKANGSLIQGNITTQSYVGYDPANPTVLGAAATLAADDRKILGNSLPKWFGGFNNTLTYENFDLNVFFRFQGGNFIMNRTRQDLLNMNFVNNSTEVLGRWKSVSEPGDGQTPKLWAARGTFVNLQDQASTRFVEKGDFLRLDNLALGYKLPSNLLTKVGISKLRVYASVQNVFVVTGYSGLDPETNTSGAGVDFNGNPQLRTFTFGLNLGF